MQLDNGRLNRLLSCLFMIGILTGWGAFPGASLVGIALAGEHDHSLMKYDRLPAMKMTDEQMLALPDGQQKLDREHHRQAEYSKRWHEIHEMVGAQHISRRAGLALQNRGLGRALLEKGNAVAGFPDKAGAIDTLKVLIIRIGFETNRDPHLATMHPSGDFDLGTYDNSDTLFVDPAPHNKSFYESHLVGLSEYYKYQSGGRLHIQGDVLPRGENDSYKLSDVADYGPGADGGWSLESLEAMVRDCMTLADAETQSDGSGVNLADYDDTDPFRYVIFVHAGSDYQSDINQDTPNDIPTFFITLGEPQALTSVNSTTGLPGSMSECSIIPETTNQDGYPGSIAAAFYHEFGHALGLLDVYNTGTALTSVGIWDLMDSGTNLPVTMGKIIAPGDTLSIQATGVLPPSLGAWNKWFLGWLQMDEIDGRDDDYVLLPVGVPQSEYPMYTSAGVGNFTTSLPQAIRGGLSSREWFLIENRWVPPSLIAPPVTPFEGLSFERDEDTGVVLYLAGFNQGSWGNSGLYDFFLPAGGVLVWHVNMDRIEAELATNTINYYGDGLRLVEADGIQDIGVLDSYVIGWLGSWRDPFGEGNGYRNLFTEGFPSSRSFDRSWTGLSLSDISTASHRNESIMKFGASLDAIKSGFPFEVAPVDSVTALAYGGNTGPRKLDVGSATAISSGSDPVLIFADTAPENWVGGPYPSSLYAIDSAGEGRWPEAEGDPEGLFHHLDAPLTGAPAMLAAHNSPTRLVAGTSNGRVDVLDFVAPAGPSLVFSVDVGDSLVQGPLPATWAGINDRIFCGVYPDSLVVLDGEGNRVGDGVRLISPLMGPYSGSESFRGKSSILNCNGDDMVAVPMSDGWFLVVQSENSFAVTWLAYPREIEGDALFSAVVPQTEDNDVQYHLFDGAGTLGSWLVSAAGAAATMDQLPGLSQALVTEPAVADLDGDGRHDIILATHEKILAFHADGVAARGFPLKLSELFPLPDSTSIAGPLVVADATGNGVNEVFFSTSGGHLLAIDAIGQLLPEHPLRWGDRRQSSLTVGPGEAQSAGRTLWLVSAGGYTGAPLDRQYVNGRISAYQFNDSRATIGTSEWLGNGGGAFRRGTSGVPTNLGSVAPSRDEQDTVLLYPNPLHDDMVNVRFVPRGERPAKFGVYNIQGELVIQQDFVVTDGVVNEYALDLSQVASGLYLCRLMFEGANGMETKVMTLAVER